MIESQSKIEIHESRKIFIKDFLEIELIESFLNTWFLKIKFNGQDSNLFIKLENTENINYFDLLKLIKSEEIND